MNTRDIVVGTVALIKDEQGRVLMLKRARPPFIGMWSLLGGHVELGEDIRATLEREVFEETGLKLKCERIAASWNEVIVKSDGTKKHFVMFVGIFEVNGRVELRHSDEGTLQWFSQAEFEKAKFRAAPSDWEVLRRLVFELKNKAMRHFEVVIEDNGGKYLMTKFEEL